MAGTLSCHVRKSSRSFGLDFGRLAPSNAFALPSGRFLPGCRLRRLVTVRFRPPSWEDGSGSSGPWAGWRTVSVCVTLTVLVPSAGRAGACCLTGCTVVSVLVSTLTVVCPPEDGADSGAGESGLRPDPPVLFSACCVMAIVAPVPRAPPTEETI